MEILVARPPQLQNGHVGIDWLVVVITVLKCVAVVVNRSVERSYSKFWIVNKMVMMIIIRIISFTFVVKRVLVTLYFLFRGPSVLSHVLEAAVEYFQISKLAELFRNEWALEHEDIPRVHQLSPIALQLFLEGERMRHVTRDVLLHHVPVALTDVITDGATPIVANEDEFLTAELLRQVGYVIGE